MDWKQLQKIVEEAGDSGHDVAGYEDMHHNWLVLMQDAGVDLENDERVEAFELLLSYAMNVLRSAAAEAEQKDA